MEIPLSMQTEKYSALRPQRANEREPNRLTLELGQIFSATVAEKTDKFTKLSSDGIEFEVPSDQIKGEAGDELQFEVVKKSSDGSVSLKQILQETGAAVSANRSNADLKNLLKQSNLYSEESLYKSDDQDLQLKAMEAMSKIRRQLSYVSNNASKSAMQELIASGLSLDKISLNILNSVMREIESKPDSQVRQDELDEMINRHMRESNVPVKDSSGVKKISRELSRQGLPVTQKNVESVSDVLNKLKSVENLDKQAVIKLVKDASPLTVENLYLAKHTTAKLPEAKNLSDETWAALEPEIQKTFAREGIERTEQTERAARLLVENEIPLTRQNVDKILYLSDVKRHLDEGQVLRQAVTNIRRDAEPSDVHIDATPNLSHIYSDLKKDIPNITASHIEYLLRSQQNPTLQNLADSLNQPTPEIAESNLSETAVSARLTLLDIQRKLTFEATQRLVGKNVNITRLPLADALAALEDAGPYAASLRAMEADASTVNISRMNELYTKLGEIKNPPAATFALLLSKAVPFTVNSVHRTISQSQLAAGYESHATAVTAKYDSFTAVSGQFEPLLQSLGIDVTQANVRAATILSRSGVDLTPENLTEVKLLDQKLTSVHNRLHPNIAASMLRDGINPLDAQIDEILDYIDKFNGQYGDDAGERLAEHIRAMDDKKELSADERKQMMAFYRALNILSKDDSAVLGLSLKYGANLTLGNMLSDAQYYRSAKKTGTISISVDDSFGELEKLENQEKNIRQLLEDIPPKTLTEYQYNSIIVDRMSSNAQPSSVQRLLKQPGAETLPADEAAGLLEEYSDTFDGSDAIEADRRAQQMLDILNDAAGLPGTGVKTLQQLQLPATIANLQAMRFLSKSQFGLGKALDDLEQRLELDETENDFDFKSFDLPDADLSELKNGETADGLLERLENQLEAAKAEPLSSSLLSELKLIQSAVKVQRFIGRSNEQASLTVPIRLGDRIATLNMYVLDENALSKTSNDLLMALDTETLGNVQVFIGRSGDGVRLELTTDKPEALPELKQNSDGLLSLVEDAGFTVTGLSFSERG